MICPACQNEIPTDSRFCGFCGFRLSPISEEDHRTLSRELAMIIEEEEPGAIPLVRRKGPSAERPRLVVVPEAMEQTAPSVLQDTAPAAPAASAAAPVVPEVLAPLSTQELQRRHATRFPLKVEVNYTSEHNFYAGFLENLSSGGLFVATHQPVVMGQMIEVTFTVPGLNHSCTAMCEVRWLREYNPDHTDTIPGMGLRFVHIAPEAQAAIELFIRHREPIFFDDD